MKAMGMKKYKEDKTRAPIKRRLNFDKKRPPPQTARYGTKPDHSAAPRNVGQRPQQQRHHAAASKRFKSAATSTPQETRTHPTNGPAPRDYSPILAPAEVTPGPSWAPPKDADNWETRKEKARQVSSWALEERI